MVRATIDLGCIIKKSPTALRCWGGITPANTAGDFCLFGDYCWTGRTGMPSHCSAVLPIPRAPSS